MAEIKVVKNRVVIDGRLYEVMAQGGGKFEIYNHNRLRTGSFSIAQKELSGEDRGVENADPAAEIGMAWAKSNLSFPVTLKAATPETAPQPAAAPAPVPREAAPPKTETAPKPIAPAAPRPAPEAPKAPAPAPSQPSTPMSRADALREATRQRAEATARAESEARASAVAPEEAPVAEQADAEDAEASPRDSVLDGGDEELLDGPIPTGSRICRIAHHAKPDLVSLQKAQTFLAWLRKQPGVQAAYLAHDPKTGKTISVTIWESREDLANIRNASPPRSASQLKSLSVDLMWIVG